MNNTGCGAHENNAYDYTCDDCVFPPNHLDHPMIGISNDEPKDFGEVPF